MKYVALQVKTSYSILNSLNDIKKLVACAYEYGYSSLAITDFENMFGVMEFYLECKKKGIKPIIGIELKYDDSIILLYAKNNNGYKNLVKLSTFVSDNELDIDTLKLYSSDLILVMPVSGFNKEVYNIYTDKYMGYSSIEEKSLVSDKGVYINDVRYLYKDDYKYLDYALMIKNGKVLGEYELGRYKDNYLKKIDEIINISSDIDIDNTYNIANSCNVTLEYIDGLLPVYDKDIDSKKYLYSLSHKGLSKRLNGCVPKEYLDRLEMELKVIDEMNFNDYFLIVYDYVLYAKKNNILVGPGRGSAAGSLVSYTLGITDVDPIKYNLLFERFLNKERVSMPDIDIDFDANKRTQVIDYVISKYGDKNVAGIITFNTFGAKQVIRDVGKILSINSKLIDNISKLCISDLRTSFNNNESLKKLISSSNDLKKLYDICLHLEGLPRHVSVNAAGVVMSKYNIDDVVPLYKNQMGMYVTGYSKDYLEMLGLLKMDFLAVSNLSFIDEVINNIRDNEGINITFSNIPMDDKKTLMLFNKGDTEGIFQFESSGMIKFLKKLKVSSFKDIYMAMSLYRPGPMDSIDDFIKRREGKIEIDYIHPDIEDILKETYGIIVYQEQIMQIACKIAGYSLGEADILRRAMAKKKEDVLVKEKEKFISRSIDRGYDKNIVNKIYDVILKFANYGFNKSHAVSYSIISYKMGFLKCHFYSYFMLSMLNNNISNEDKSNAYIALLRQKKVKVLGPSINKSSNKYIILDKKIICPLSVIKNVGVGVSSLILREREKGEFISIFDFVMRVSSINRKEIECLFLSGVMDEFGFNRRTLMENLDNIINYVELCNGSDIELEKPLIEVYPEYDRDTLIKNEFKCYGFYLTEHPVSRYRDNININSLMLEDYDNKYIELVLEVNNIREVVTKNNDVMAFIKASDEYRYISLTLFPKIYNVNKDINNLDIIKVYGRVEKRFDNYQIVVSNIKKIN